MKTYFVALLLLVVQVICGQELECCGSKEVGEFSYSLVKTSKKIPSKCLNNCTYTRNGEPGNVYCFARGTEPVKCLGEEEVLLTDNTCTRGEADFHKADPSEAWLQRCESKMETANFSVAVAHGIHSLTLQDLREFFDEETKPENGIPTANRNLCAEGEDIVLKNAPDIPSEFASFGMRTLDIQIQNMDDVNYADNADILQRLIHSFHMVTTWKAAKPHFEQFEANGVSPDVCDCVLDTSENGINQELKNIFFWFRECHKRLIYIDYYEQLLNNCKAPTIIVTTPQSWEEEKKHIHESMLPDEDIKKFAMFLYCGLRA